MSFFSRPNLDNEQFKQLSDNVLTLSGQTRIASVTGLTLTDGSGGYIPIIATGGTNNKVLTYINGEIVLKSISGGTGSGVYSGASPTTCTVGGLCSGSAIAGCSITNILQSILVPAIPLTTSLSIATGGASRQYGDCSVGNLCYSVVKNTNAICAISASTCGNGVYNCNIPAGAGNTCSGTVPYTYVFGCATPATGITSTSVGFILCAKTCANEGSTATASITWQNKKFSFANSTLYNSSAIGTVLNATPGTLSSSKALTCTMVLNNQFFYYVYPKAFGTPSFTVNGLPNNAWGNAGSGTLFTITYVNTNGYSNQYYVARSDNKITGTYNIIVS